MPSMGPSSYGKDQLKSSVQLQITQAIDSVAPWLDVNSNPLSFDSEVTRQGTLLNNGPFAGGYREEGYVLPGRDQHMANKSSSSSS